MVFPPLVPKGDEKEGPCVCVCVCGAPANACVELGVGLSAPWPPLARCGSEKSWRLMGEVIKSGVVATLPLQGEVQSRPRGGGGVGAEGMRRGDASYRLPSSLHSSRLYLHPVPGESGAGWGPGLPTPASGLCAEGEVTWLAYTMALSQFQPRLLQR